MYILNKWLSVNYLYIHSYGRNCSHSVPWGHVRIHYVAFE